ncbi:hypothetical protein [Nonomuraea sp. NPDC050783]|uniref:hypothetical protein n=1 Tax=Nonomuraea sp. NPDC050783 TaxID=3154634 RepID=UPI00346780DF
MGSGQVQEGRGAGPDGGAAAREADIIGFNGAASSAHDGSGLPARLGFGHVTVHEGALEAMGAVIGLLR